MCRAIWVDILPNRQTPVATAGSQLLWLAWQFARQTISRRQTGRYQLNSGRGSRGKEFGMVAINENHVTLVGTTPVLWYRRIVAKSWPRAGRRRRLAVLLGFVS